MLYLESNSKPDISFAFNHCALLTYKPNHHLRLMLWIYDGVHTKISPTISLSVMYRKIFILWRNRTNSWYRAHLYFSTCLFSLYVVLKRGIITIRYILDTHLFSIFFQCHVITIFSVFGAESEIMYILLVYICFSFHNKHFWLYQSHCSYVYFNRIIWQLSITITPARRPLKDGAILGSANHGEVDLDSILNHLASGKLRQSNTVPSQCKIFYYIWMWHIMHVDRWSNFKKRLGVI